MPSFYISTFGSVIYPEVCFFVLFFFLFLPRYWFISSFFRCCDIVSKLLWSATNRKRKRETEKKDLTTWTSTSCFLLWFWFGTKRNLFEKKTRAHVGLYIKRERERKTRKFGSRTRSWGSMCVFWGGLFCLFLSRLPAEVAEEDSMSKAPKRKRRRLPRWNRRVDKMTIAWYRFL